MISCFSNFKSINLEPDSIITVNTDRLSTTSFKGNVCVRPIKKVCLQCFVLMSSLIEPDKEAFFTERDFFKLALF